MFLCVFCFRGFAFFFCCCFFFFKQKTAYELRISDWSSDVCSSDLLQRLDREAGLLRAVEAGDHRIELLTDLIALGALFVAVAAKVRALDEEIGRASCREKCVSTCRSRW